MKEAGTAEVVEVEAVEAEAVEAVGDSNSSRVKWFICFISLFASD